MMLQGKTVHNIVNHCDYSIKKCGRDRPCKIIEKQKGVIDREIQLENMLLGGYVIKHEESGNSVHKEEV